MPGPATQNIVFDQFKDNYLSAKRGAPPQFDDQEKSEREDAAQAYARENEKHFVDYCRDCIDTSTSANKDILRTQEDCFRVFLEKEPISYQFKEEWQSRVVIPKPYAAVMYGAAAVKKAFSPDFLTIEKENNKLSEKFWQEVLATQLDSRHANFPVRFVDASIMALATGPSMEMIPRFTSGIGLTIDLVEPWKIRRDPDAPPRDPQGGLYWIHQEWLDYHVLKRMEKVGKYFDVDRIKGDEKENPNNPMMTKDAIAKRKNQTWRRSSFRHMSLASELYGTILSPKAEELLPSGTYTVAGGRLIEVPKSTPYGWLRWPGVSFSAMPDLLRFGGRGLVEGIITLWESMCNIMCLHEDGLKYIINPPTEVCVNNLVDEEDVDHWPGKIYQTRDTVSGHQVIRPMDRHDATSSVLANLQYHDQLFQRGSMVTDSVQGLPGYRAEVTAHEAAQNLDQAMGVFGLMGGNLEDGAVQVLNAIVDVISSFATVADLFPDLSEETQQKVMAAGGRMPKLNGRFSISGMQELLRQADTLRYLTTIVIPMAEKPTWAPFINRYETLKAFESRTNLKDENIIVDEATARQIMGSQPNGNPELPGGQAGPGGPTPLHEQDKRGPKVEA